MTSPDLTPGEHTASAAIDEAARYLVAVPPEERPRPLVPALREMFGLTPVEACQAIAESHRLRSVAA